MDNSLLIKECSQTPESHFLKNATLSISAGDKAERGVTLICHQKKVECQCSCLLEFQFHYIITEFYIHILLEGMSNQYRHYPLLVVLQSRN